MTSSASGGDRNESHGYPWTVERWGTEGRPIVILNDPAFDRSAWWVIAADLADTYTVVVLEYACDTANDQSGARLQARAEMLGCFVADLADRAPVIVGHGRTAAVALEFGARFAAQAILVVAARQRTPPRRGAPLICGPHQTAPGYTEMAHPARPATRLAVYGVVDPCPHLADPARFTADLRGLAG